jgi:O-antigen/teichoic acid export membrane protein
MTRATAAIARHTLAYATGSILGGITRAVLLPIVARRLASEEFGVYSLLLAATNLLHLLFEPGLVQAMIRFHHRTDDPLERRRIRSVLFVGMPLLDLLVAAPVLIFRDVASRLLFGTPEHGDLIAIAALIAFFAAQFQLYLGHLRADDRSRSFALWMGLRGAISLSATFLLVIVWGGGLVAFLLGNLMGPAIVTLIAVPRHLWRDGIDLSGWTLKGKELLRFGAPLVPAAIGLWTLTYLDAYLLRILVGLEAVGIYNFAAEICIPVALMMGAISLAWPSFAFARAREEDGPAVIARVFRHLFVALIAGSLAVALFRREILAVVGSPTFRDSLPLVPLLALATCLYGAALVFGTGLQVTGATKRMPPLVIAAILVNGALVLLLVPSLQQLGAAIAAAGTNVFFAAAVLRASQKEFPVPFEIGKLFAALVAAAGVLFAGEWIGDRSLLSGLILRLFVFALFPAILAALGAVSWRELRAVPQVLGEIMRGEARRSIA